MTETVTETPAPVRDKTVIVEVPKDSRLEGLLTLRDSLKEKRDAAQQAYDENKEGILRELMLLYPDQDIKVYEMQGTRMWKRMTYTFSRTPYLPGKLIEEHLPVVYEAFKRYKQGWTLR